MGNDRLWRPYKVRAELPDAAELNLLGLEKRWQICTLSSENGNGIVASVDKLRGTKFKVANFSMSAAQSYIDSENINAQLLCKPNGDMLYGHYHESGGIRYITGLQYFVVVTANCYTECENPITEWEIMCVRFNQKSRNGHSIKVIEETFYVSMPTNLRARYTLGKQMENKPLPSHDDVVAEVTKKVESIPDAVARHKLANFIHAMAATYIQAFGGDTEQSEREEIPVENQAIRPPLTLVAADDPSPIEQEIIMASTDDSSPTEEQVILEDIGTDGPIPLTDEVDYSIADEQAAAMAAAKELHHRRDRGKGKENRLEVRA